jgi:O-acetylserine/cysteine efflux transporter
MPIRDILLAVLATAVWGFNFVVIKWGVDEVPPLFLTVLRFAATALPAMLLVARPTSPMRVVALYGLVMGSIQFGLLFVAMKLGFSASLSSLVMQMQAFFTMGLAAWLLNDRPRPVQIAGALVAIAGVALIATTRWTPQAILPFMLVMAAAFFWGLSNIIAKRSGEKKPFSFVIWSSLFATPPLLLLSLLTEDHATILNIISKPSLTVMFTTLYLAWGSTLVGYGLWNLLLSRHAAATVAPFTLLVPIFGIISGVLVLGESVSGLAMAGAALVFAGLLINVFGPKLLSPRTNQTAR